MVLVLVAEVGVVGVGGVMSCDCSHSDRAVLSYRSSSFVVIVCLFVVHNQNTSERNRQGYFASLQCSSVHHYSAVQYSNGSESTARLSEVQYSTGQ